MNQTMTKLAPPRIEQGQPMTFVGLSELQPMDNNHIPDQWKRFAPHLGKIPGQVGTSAFGVSFCDCEATGTMIDYLAAVQVSGEGDVPAGLTRRTIPAHRYAVFTHTGNVSTIKESLAYIWQEWMATSGYQSARNPECVEVYDDRFDPMTGNGGFEIWIAIK